MPSPANRRMPLSCEPCRERKIRCPRNVSGSKGPCESCVRRGIPPTECVFLREVYAAERQKSRQGTLENNNQAELLERIAGLEDLLRRHVGENTSSNDTSSLRRESSGSSLTPGHPGNAAASTRTPTSEIAYLTPASSIQPSNQSTGRLVRTRTGHEHYEPASSNWSSLLKSNPATNVLDAEIDGLQVASEFPIATKPVDKEELMSILPPMSQCDELKDVYFNVFSPLWHVLHDPTFAEDYARFRSHPSEASLPWLALLFAVLSVAVPALDADGRLLQDLGRQSTPTENVAVLTGRYRGAAMQCLEADRYLWRHNLHTLQALIILIYGINHSHGQSWALLGLAKNIALALGCHVDPENFGLGVVRAEERRRAWAGLNMLYTIQNSAMGNIDATLIQNHVKLPLDIDDEVLAASAHTPPPSAAPSRMSYLVYKFVLYDICGRLSRELFSQHAMPTYETINALDEEIQAQQESWHIKYMIDSQSSSLPFYHAVQLNILFCYSHQLFLLLHRPVLMHQNSTESVLHFTPEQARKSRSRCIDSARAILAIHRTLEEDESFRPYRWFNRGLASFHAFHAAVLLVYALAAYHDMEPSLVDAMHRELENGIAVFERIAARGMSRISTKATPILKKLYSLTCARQRPQYHEAQTPLPAVSSHHLEPNQTGVPFNPQLYPEISQNTMNALFGNLNPHQWLSPGGMNWNEWDFMLDDSSALILPAA